MFKDVSASVKKKCCRKQALSLGELIAAVYEGCGNHGQAAGMIRLAIDARIIAFRGRQRLVSE